MASVTVAENGATTAVRAVEFFSGIGGMRYALGQVRGAESTVVGAFDFSTTANEVYRHNFGGKKPSQKPIQSISCEYLQSLGANMWLMSPPCQPYTRQNETKKRDLLDKRSNALVHLCGVLEEIETPPTYILLENVLNFERSDSCNKVKETLRKRGYQFHLHMLSPENFSTPNTRPRVFMIATLDVGVDLSPKFFPPGPAKTREVGHYLRHDLNIEQLLIPEGTLASAGSWSLDIVAPASTRSACFTHSYGRYMKGTGSVILMPTEAKEKDKERLLNGFSNSLDALMSADGMSGSSTAVGQRSDWYKPYLGKLRYFDPHEITNILGFPKSFSFPDNVPLHKQYALAGNSLHVAAVTSLLQLFFAPRTAGGKKRKLDTTSG